jgi:hypothetical protein
MKTSSINLDAKKEEEDLGKLLDRQRFLARSGIDDYAEKGQRTKERKRQEKQEIDKAEQQPEEEINENFLKHSDEKNQNPENIVDDQIKNCQIDETLGEGEQKTDNEEIDESKELQKEDVQLEESISNAIN